jgi:glycine cleavage system H protein
VTLVSFLGERRLEITTEKKTYMFPLDRFYYTHDPGHIWFKSVNSLFEVGFDDFGQFQAGKILHVRTRPIGKEFAKGSAFGTVESHKWIGPLRLPLSATLVEVNSEVLENPGGINKEPYSAWLIRIKPTNLDEERSSQDIIPKGDLEHLKQYITSELEKYDDPPI